MDVKRYPHRAYRYWLYDPEYDGMMFFRRQEERDTAAANAIRGHLTLDGWDEEVENICCGTLTHVATMTEIVERPTDLDDDGIDGDGMYWEEGVSCSCKYAMVGVDEELNNVAD